MMTNYNKNVIVIDDRRKRDAANKSCSKSNPSASLVQRIFYKRLNLMKIRLFLPFMVGRV